MIRQGCTAKAEISFRSSKSWGRIFPLLLVLFLTGGPLAAGDPPIGAELPRSVVMAGERLFVLCGDPLRLFQISSIDGRVIRELGLPEGFVSDPECGLALDRRELYLATGNQQVFVLDSLDGSLLRVLDIPREHPVTGMAIVPGEGLLIGTYLPETPPGTKGGVTAISANGYYSPLDGSLIRPFVPVNLLDGWGAGPLGRLFAWNPVEQGIEEVDEVTGAQLGFVPGDSILAMDGTAVAYSGRNLFFTGTSTELIKIIDPKEQRVLRAFPPPLTPVCALAAGPIEPNLRIHRAEDFPLRLSGSFRSRTRTLDNGEVRFFLEGQSASDAAILRSFEFTGECAAEVFDVTLTEADFGVPNGIFHFYGIAADTSVPPVTTTLPLALDRQAVLILDNIAPFVRVVRPLNGELLTQSDYIEETDSFLVTGFLSDPLSGLRQVDFYAAPVGGEPHLVESREVMGQGITLVDFVWDPASNGEYDLFLRAFDHAGNETDSEANRVTVNRDLVEPPAGDPLPTEAHRLFSATADFSEILSSITIAELDGDLEPELVFGTDRTNTADSMDPDFEVLKDDRGMGVFAINLDGTPVHGIWPVILDVDIRSSPAAADLDGDGLDEIVVGTYSSAAGTFPQVPNGVRIFEESGEQIALVESTFSVFSSPAIGNLDDDPELEIVIGTSDGTLLALNGDGSALNPNWPITLPRRPAPFNARNDVDSSPAIGDLDGDGFPEIAVVSDDGVIYAYRAEGTPLHGFPVIPPADTFHQPVSVAANSSSPLIADVDGDGLGELVAALSNARVYALNSDGSDVPGFPLRLPPEANPEESSPNEGDEILSTPSLGDIDSDGLLELGVAFYHGPENETRVYVYDLPAPAVNSTLDWPTFQQQPFRNGYYPGQASGDVNHDGIVDLLDKTRFPLTWYRHSTMPSFRPEFDFDASKRVDGIDLNGLLGVERD